MWLQSLELQGHGLQTILVSNEKKVGTSLNKNLHFNLNSYFVTGSKQFVDFVP